MYLHEYFGSQGLAPPDSVVWWAVHTRHQHESSVRELLSMKGFDTFLPTYKQLRRWKDRKKEITAPLFPGYIFVANAGDERLRIVTTPGVCSIVSIGGTPSVIPSYEIESVRRAIAGPSPIEPHIYLREGDRVRITSGPLAGLEGILVRTKTTCRLVICVEMLGRAAAVEIDGNSVEPMRQPVHRPILRSAAPSIPDSRELAV